MAKKGRAWNIILCCMWAGVLLVGVVLPIAMNRTYSKPSAPPLGRLAIYNETGTKFSEWERNEAIKFSLDQVDSSIKYLFIGAATLLGFIVKILIDPLLSKPTDPGTTPLELSPGLKLMFIHTAVGCFISISCGFLARLYFTRLADQESFSIYDEVGFSSLGQLLSFLLAGFLLIIAAGFLVKR